MNNSKEYIADLLARFMEGETTLDEEQQIAHYMATHEVGEEWQPYKEMFAFFDRGMTDETDREAASNPTAAIEPLTGNEPSGGRRRSIWRMLATAVVFLTVTGVAVWLVRKTNDSQPATYPSSVVAEKTDSARSSSPAQPVHPSAPTAPLATLPTRTDKVKAHNAECDAHLTAVSRQNGQRESALQPSREAKKTQNQGERQVLPSSPPNTVFRPDSTLLAQMQGERELAQMGLEADLIVVHDQAMAAQLECQFDIMQARRAMAAVDREKESELNIIY